MRGGYSLWCARFTNLLAIYTSHPKSFFLAKLVQGSSVWWWGSLYPRLYSPRMKFYFFQNEAYFEAVLPQKQGPDDT